MNRRRRPFGPSANDRPSEDRARRWRSVSRRIRHEHEHRCRTPGEPTMVRACRALRNSDRVERDARGTNEAGACDVRCADQPVHSDVVRTSPSSCAYARSKTSPAEQCSCSSSAGSGGLALRDRRGSRSDPRSTCVGRRTSRGGFPQGSRGTAQAGGVRPSAPYAPGPWCRGELR
jgi:hypothetical protein